MKRIIALLTLVALVGLCNSSAVAASPVVSLDATNLVLGPSMAYITASGNTPIKVGAGRFYEIINESVSAQPAGACTWFDNPSTNSGPQLFAENGIGSSQIVLMFGLFGLPFANGLTVNCGVAPTVSLLVIYT